MARTKKPARTKKSELAKSKEKIMGRKMKRREKQVQSKIVLSKREGYTTGTISLVGGGRKPRNRPQPSSEEDGEEEDSHVDDGDSYGSLIETDSVETDDDQYLSRPDTPPKKRFSFGKSSYLDESGFNKVGNDQARIQRRREKGAGDWRTEGAIDY